MAGSSILFQVEVADDRLLAEALSIPEHEVYVDLVPGAKLTYSGTPIERRGGDVLPYVVGFVLDVAAQVTATSFVGIWALLRQKLRQGGAQNITIIYAPTINIAPQVGKTEEELAAEQAQKVLQALESLRQLME